jgi:hypothetical protein
LYTCIANQLHDLAAAPQHEKEQIVAFSQDKDEWALTVESTMDETRAYGESIDASLSEYLSRPVKIHETTWTTAAGSLTFTLNPWTLFLTNTGVRNRVEGYKLLQAKMHIRVAINGSPFLYGRAIMAYEPYALYNKFYATAFNDPIIAQYSMLPHLFVDPSTSTGGTLTLPFFNADNWIDLIGTTYNSMGVLYFQSINDLYHANSAAGSANISIFASLSDVKLSGPTTATYATYDAQSGIEPNTVLLAVLVVCNIITTVLRFGKHLVAYIRGDETISTVEAVLQPQSGDEYGTGIVSKPASVIASVAGVLTKVPILEPYARATEKVAQGLGRFAHWFGFSRPAVVTDIVRCKSHGAGILAHTDEHEAVVKLTLDSKQELSVDSRIAGLNGLDEMSMNYIAQREMFLDSFQWRENQAVETQLRKINVCPMMHIYSNEGVDGGSLRLAPMFTVAAPFKYWRGTMHYRIQIVASQLHRGRLRIQYDPHFADPASELNENYSLIVDLASNRDFSFKVGWGAAQGWLQVDDDILTGSDVNHANAPLSYLHHNGQISISVLNVLTSPDPSLANPIWINLYACACDDFELAGPHEELINNLEYYPQSGEEAVAIDSAPEKSESMVTLNSDPKSDNIYHVNFGEAIRSVRTLLKRYCFHSSVGSDTDFWWCEYNFPYYNGERSFNRHATAALVGYNYSAMTLLNWFVPCYTGWRGGLRSKYVPSSDRGKIMVRRHRPVNAVTDIGQGDFVLPASSSELNDFLIGIHATCTAGAHVSCCNTDGAAEIEFPFYNSKRFAPARNQAIGAGNLHLGDCDSHVGYWFGSDAYNFHISRFVAAGDDFSLFLFVGQPLLLYRSRPSSGGVMILP